MYSRRQTRTPFWILGITILKNTTDQRDYGDNDDDDNDDDADADGNSDGNSDGDSYGDNDGGGTDHSHV